MDISNINLANTYILRIAQLNASKTNINAVAVVHFELQNFAGIPIYLPGLEEELKTDATPDNDYGTASNTYKAAIIAAVDAEIASLNAAILALACTTG